MELTQHIAKQLRDVHHGGNWTGVNLKDKLSGLTWQEATTKIGDFHCIATLVFHMNYYADAILKVFAGGPLDAKDDYSFDGPAVESDEDWKRLTQQAWDNVDTLAQRIEAMPERQLWETFVDDKYGTYYRNLHGLIEHYHYHLGQVAMVRAMVKSA